MNPASDARADLAPAALVIAESEPWTVSAAFARAVAEWGTRPFLEDKDEWLTYEAAGAEVSRRAAGLVRLGVEPGARVILALRNGADAVLTWLAVDAAGAVAVPLPAELGEAAAVIGAECRPCLAVVEEEERSQWSGLAPAGAAFAVSTPGELEPAPGASPSPRRVARPGDVALLSYERLDEPRPGGCLITQGQLTHAAEQMLELTAQSAEETSWCALPVTSAEAIATVVVPSILVGAALSVAEAPGPLELWPDVLRTGARLAALTERLMAAAALRSESRAELSCRGQLRIVTGACPPGDLQDLWSARFAVDVPGLPYYWRPEAGLLAGVLCGEYSPVGSVGRPLPDYDVRILGTEDDELPAGAVGEIVCRPRHPHSLFKGYWERPDATVAATANLWFHTGDLGRFDDDRFLYLDRTEGNAHSCPTTGRSGSVSPMRRSTTPG